MSVIFKTLKKLRGQSLEAQERDERLKRGRNIYSFRRIIFSPTGILLIALLMFFSGMATIYSVRYLKRYFERESKEIVVNEKEKTQIANSEIEKAADELTKENTVFEDAIAVPPPPHTIPIEESTKEKVDILSIGNKKIPAKATRIVRYTPPRFPKSTQEKEKKIASVGAPEQLLGSQKEVSKALTPISTTSLPMSSKVSEAPPSSIPKIKPDLEKDTKELPGVGPDSPKEDRAKSPAMMQPPSKAFDEGAVEKKPSGPEKRVLLEKTVQLREEDKNEDERIRLENVERSARIASLVAKIRISIGTKRNDQLEDLIDELALLKGKGSSYVLKLRAFLYMRKNEYESAASLLNDVLRKNENDLEAGINMAIVEIKTGQTPKAIKRLAALREMHPENTLITELIQKLK